MEVWFPGVTRDFFFPRITFQCRDSAAGRASKLKSQVQYWWRFDSWCDKGFCSPRLVFGAGSLTMFVQPWLCAVACINIVCSLTFSLPVNCITSAVSSQGQSLQKRLSRSNSLFGELCMAWEYVKTWNSQSGSRMTSYKVDGKHFASDVLGQWMG